MPVTREEVIGSFEVLLGRKPESEFVIEDKIRHCRSLGRLVDAITLSSEFRLRTDRADLGGDRDRILDEIRARAGTGGDRRTIAGAVIRLLMRPFAFGVAGDNILILRILRQTLPRHWTGYALALAMMTVVSACTASIAYMIGTIVNATVETRDMTTVAVLSLAWMGIFTVRGLAAYVQELSLARTANRITAGVQKALFARLLRQGVGYFADRRSSEFMNSAVMGAGSLANITTQLVQAAGRDILMIVCLVATMVYQSPQMALVCLLVLPAVLLGVEKLVMRGREMAATQINGAERILGSMQEVIQGFRIVKAFRLETRLATRADANIDRLERASNDLARVSNWSSPLVETLGGVAVGLACLYSGYRTLVANAMPGEFVSFILAFILIFDPARRLARLKIDLGGNLVMAQMLYTFFDAPAEEEEKVAKPALAVTAGRIEPSRIDFGYRPDTPVLRTLSLVAEPGQMTALVGLSGGGKTTIFNLLLRFFDPASGEIRIDGQDTRSVSLASLRDAISFVGQDIYLFEGTIRENILIGNPEASEEQMIAASRAAFAHDFVTAFPLGYDSPVGESGSLLSQGQRQRVALARALLKDAPIVLLDEPTAALDAESEHAVQMAIRRLCAGKTTLAIAHRLNTIRDADRIYVIDNGAVAEAGRHEDLVASHGRYASFVDLQFKDP